MDLQHGLIFLKSWDIYTVFWFCLHNNDDNISSSNTPVKKEEKTNNEPNKQQHVFNHYIANTWS